MDPTIAEILSHIQDRQDRHTLGELLKKYEVLRVRLLVKPPGLESDREAIKYFKERLASWELWYKANEKNIQDIYAKNKDLREKMSRLEEQMKELLLKWNPPPKLKLFQGPSKAPKTKRANGARR